MAYYHTITISVIVCSAIYIGYLEFKKVNRRLVNMEELMKGIRIQQQHLHNHTRNITMKNTKPLAEVSEQQTGGQSQSEQNATSENNTEQLEDDYSDYDSETDTESDGEDNQEFTEEFQDKISKLETTYQNSSSNQEETENNNENSVEEEDDEEEDDDEDDDDDDEEEALEINLNSVLEPFTTILNNSDTMEEIEFYERFQVLTCKDIRNLLKKHNLSPYGNKEKILHKLFAFKQSQTISN